MSRLFTKNVANYINMGNNTIGSLLNGATAASAHAWVYANTLSNTNIISNSVVAVRNSSQRGISIGVSNNVAPAGVYIVGSSNAEANISNKGSLTFNTGVWTSIGGINNYTTGFQTIFLNGVRDVSLVAAFTSATYIQNNAAVGDCISGEGAPPSAIDRQWDGYIAEIGIWSFALPDDGFLSLSKGISPLQVYPKNLIYYLPLYGTTSSEIDRINNVIGTINGTINQADHSPTFSASSVGQ